MALITSETAAGMARLGQEAAKANKAKIASKLAIIEAANWEEQERFRVREHIARLNEDLFLATDSVDKLRLTQALSKLYEVAGLPKAGAFRPVAPKATKTVVGEPLD